MARYGGFCRIACNGNGIVLPEPLFSLSARDIIEPLVMIGQSSGDRTGLAVIDVWYYYWQVILVSIITLSFAVLFLTKSGKIAARVSYYIDTTPPPKQEEEDDDNPPTEEPSTEGGTDEQAG